MQDLQERQALVSHLDAADSRGSAVPKRLKGASSPWKSTYSTTNDQNAFSLAAFSTALWHIVRSAFCLH